MIKTKRDLKYYLEEDRKAFGKERKWKFKSVFFPDDNFRFMKLLRHWEYHYNTHHKIRTLFYAFRCGRLGRKIRVSLPPNVAGPGFHLTHGNFIANEKAKVGAHCKVFDGVTIGGTGRYDKNFAPQIGDRVVLCSGAKVNGNIRILDDVVVGANAVVTHDILEKGITVAGIPAKKISEQNSAPYLNRAL